MTTIRLNGWKLGACAAFALVVASASPVLAAQKHFDSADAAVAALVAAARADDRVALGAIFGPDAKQVIPSGDPVADRAAVERFVERAGERVHLQRVGDDFAVLYVGNDDWPFAIPLVKEKSGWIFDTVAGQAELLNRRIGRNELDTIYTCHEYVPAQREYARRVGGGVEYAQHIISRPGKRDGLYWETGDGEDESPIGPAVAAASKGGYHFATGRPDPFHGYLYRVLTAAGPHAPGGERSYIKDGRMTGGFALLAYPARYGVSGIMSFQVNENGVVFQKDLGPRTEDIAVKITDYDPDDSWDPTE